MNRRHGQAVIEFLAIIGAVIAMVVLAAPLSDRFTDLFGNSAQRIDTAAMRMAELPPWGAERVQTPPGLPGGDEIIEEDPSGPPGSRGPRSGTPPTDSGSGSGSGRGGRGGRGSGGGGGGGGGSVGGGSSGGVPPLAGPGPTTVPAVPPRPALQVFPPTDVELAQINAAAELLLASTVTFNLFDFTLGQTVAHSLAQTVTAIIQFGVPVAVGNLSEALGALAAVFSFPKADGTVDFTKPILMAFDQSFLANSSTEEIAAILAHEGWHVNQLFNGTMDDFIHFPRVVDIEYEAFVAGAAAWNDMKGSQTDGNLDAGSACVAAGEARCKEILAVNFGYGTGTRP